MPIGKYSIQASVLTDFPRLEECWGYTELLLVLRLVILWRSSVVCALQISSAMSVIVGKRDIKIAVGSIIVQRISISMRNRSGCHFYMVP